MNSKEFKAEKKLKTNKPHLKNGGQQIFVLPPNLLQKLGINLGSMGSNSIPTDMGHNMSTCVPNHKHGHSSSNTEPEKICNIVKNETSIIKTASLMKESLFLSPTFNTTNLNNVTSSLIEEYAQDCNTEIDDASEKRKDVVDEKYNSSNVVPEHEDKHNGRACDVDLSVEFNTPQVNGSINLEKSVSQNEMRKVINIISEETVTVAKLNELKVLQIPPKNTMIPASLNTIIVKNAKKNPTQFPTLSTLTKDFIDNINLKCSKPDDKLISNEIEMPKTENIINMDPKVNIITENIFNSDNNENLTLNFEKNEHVLEYKDISDKDIQVIDYKITDENKSFDNDNSQLMLSNSIIKGNADVPFVEKSLGFSVTQNNFGITYKAIDNESVSTDRDFNEDKKSPISNKDCQKQSIKNELLLNNDTNVVTHVNDDILESVKKIDCITQSIECCLPHIINTNNNICDHNKLYVDQNDMHVLKNTTYVENNQQNSSSSTSSISSSRNNKDDSYDIEESKSCFIDTAIEQSSIVNNLKKYNPITFEINENISVDEQKIPLKISNDNMKLPDLTENLQSVKKQSEELNKMSLSLNPKRNNLMSKLCIQGVEKPGGIKTDIERRVSLKTYSNNKKRKLHEKCFSSEEIIFDVKFDHSSSIDSNETKLINLFPSQQFCKCCDYGILDYNQFENSYEHIHFTMRRPLDCNPDIIFSIYDNKIINIGETRENIDYIEDNTDQTDSEYTGHSICWYNADSLQNRFDTHLANSEKHGQVYFKNSQDSELIEIDNHLMKIHHDKNSDFNIDYQNQASIVNNSEDKLEAKSHLNSLPDVMNMEVTTEVDAKSFSKNFNNNSSKLDLQNLIRKRKTSNNSDEVSNNKKIKKVLKHEVDKEKRVESQQKHKVVEQGFKGWMASDNMVKEEFHNVAEKKENITCAVCAINMKNSEWSSHIASTHDYIAWKEGEPPVNLEDEDAIRDHLHQVVQELGHLKCNNCGLSRKYAKSFLHHIKSCYSSLNTNDDRQVPYHLSKIIEVITTTDCELCGQKYRNDKEYAMHVKKCSRKSALCTRSSNEDTYVEVPTNVTCGVCKKEVSSLEWITHIQREHNYQAWREGETPLDLQDEQSIWKHLYRIQQWYGPLVCAKCGKARRYVKLFLQHIESCTGLKEPDNTLDICYVEFESIFDKSLDDTGSENTKSVKCGVCQLEMDSKQWINHIQENHNYLSWQEGKTPLDLTDKDVVRRYLYGVVQKLGTLTCAKCGITRKYVKNYLSHVENCTGPLDSDPNNTNNNSMDVNVSVQQLNTTSPLPTGASQAQLVTTVKCGVCQKEIKNTNWIPHIGMNHEYVAWKETESPIDVSNYEAIFQHLTNMIGDIGALKCVECGKKRKHAKAYLLHIKACYGKTYVGIEDGNSTFNDTVSDMDSTLDTTCVDEEDNATGVVKCGVCSEEMEARLWIDHIQKQHNYLAWRDGDTALDCENKELIRSHLQSIVRKTRRLTCAKCGLRRRKVIPFHTHIQTCDGTGISLNESLKILTQKPENSEGIVKCAVCQSEMVDTFWINHIAKEHDYMAWRDGEKPLNMDDEASVKDHLYKISQYAGELICSKCGQSRKYVRSYLQHTRGCTGSTESTDGTVKVCKLKRKSLEMVTCAVCRIEIDDSLWFEHISKEHNYVSWKQNDPPLVFKDEKSLRDHLYNIVQSIGSLVCSKCGLVRKYAKAYLMHIETCQKVTWRSINKMIMRIKTKKEKGDIVRCAVCGAEVDDTEWVEHIASQHNYLAWRDRDPAINLDNLDAVRDHLKNIIQEVGYLKCPKCNVQRKYAKLYLQHVINCDGTVEENVEINDSVIDIELASDDAEMDDPDGSVVVKCGVCAEEVVRSAWFTHILKVHKYLAWEEGHEPIDLNDKEAVYKHLSAINIKCKGLTCGSCGVVRKYVKAYLHHVADCSERHYVGSNETVECGVCGEKVVGKYWREHAMETHYNVAWVVGEAPIDVRNIFSVDKYLKEYQEYKHRLVCNICGLSRVSLAGFYAHILICGKTDEEIDAWKDMCDICNQKYLCIYKTQHYWAHRVQEMTKERKIQDTLKKEETLKDEVNYTPGRRKAAEKARSVIGDYAAKFASHKCKSCTFEADNKEDLASHRCSKRALNSNEDSDDSVSIKLEDYSEEESEDTDVDSGLSNEDEEPSVSINMQKDTRNDTIGAKLSSKSSKFPFEVRDAKPYLQQSKYDHFKLYNTKETLFSHWRDCTYEVVLEESLSQYMPQLEESCKVSISNGSWTTYKRFESRKEKGCKVLFTGGSIQCISWAPGHPDGTKACHSLLAVATHRGPDCPRLHCTDTVSHPALIQMWDFQDFRSLPKLAFGLAHDYGTVWAMDWCPSGARDISERVKSDNNMRPRLGLLALACSNGSAYVISVPYQDDSGTNDITFYKIKPCVELRVTRGNNKYQATSINWSLFKGYTTILVGYGDGTVALYDLVTESPLLTAKDGDIDVLYPFQDERVHNSCVTGLTSCVLGAWCSSSATGSTAGVAEADPPAGRGARPLRAHSALAASIPTFMPHWPNVMLSGDDTIVGLSPSELEWGYVGRRVGSVRALAPCLHRARIAAIVPPLLQAMRPHPAAFKGHKTIHKKNVAMLEMTPLAKKRSKHCNDELSMKVEPITYEDAIASYGIEFKFERDFDKAFVHRMQQKHRVPFPERFPLADVPALAYCPAAAHYTKLAIATHSGLLLLLDV